jgi:hypothetical protein
MRDARAAVTGSPLALWLGTLGYLVAVEQIGHTVRLASAAPRNGVGNRKSFEEAAKEFGDPSLTGADRGILYDVRCALAHEYGLTGNHKVFIYARTGALIHRPLSGALRINLVEIWTYVEKLVERVRAEHARGAVAIVDGVRPEDVFAMQFSVVP